MTFHLFSILDKLIPTRTACCSSNINPFPHLINPFFTLSLLFFIFRPKEEAAQYNSSIAPINPKQIFIRVPGEILLTPSFFPSSLYLTYHVSFYLASLCRSSRALINPFGLQKKIYRDESKMFCLKIQECRCWRGACLTMYQSPFPILSILV